MTSRSEPKLRPWDLQPGESLKAYEAFAIYRDLGAKRTQPAVCAQLAKSRGLISRWAAAYKWTDRIAAYEAEQARRVSEAVEETNAQVRARHARAASKAHSIFARRLESIAAADEAQLAEGKVNMIDPVDATRAMVAAAREERDARGMLPVEPEPGTKMVIAIVRMDLSDL